MLPLSEVLNRFPRILRDLSVAHQKPATLTLTGADLLIDRAILEKLHDPLLHLLRNAFDHGIEPPHLRQHRAKPTQGQIEICALHQGNQTIIEVRDDGQGIDLDRIRERARELGWFSAEQIAALSAAALIELIFEPNFSTAAQVSELSGRGFGLDVVRSDLNAIRGKVSVTSLPGQGTTFTLVLPLTLTITQLIICLVGSLPVALPADSIADILVPQRLEQSQAGLQLQWRDQVIPVYAFSNLLNYACPIPQSVASQLLAAFPAPKDWASPVVVVRREQQYFGLAVERIITEQELVIKPFGSALAPPSYLYGCTILGDGSMVPVVDAAALLALLSDSTVHRAIPTAVQTVQAPTILVVDDAITLRRTLALFLEREGFRVLQAQDGQEALDQLQRSAVQLVVCDIEMPNLNGFEFLNARRQAPQLAQIPVVMLTSRSNEKHRWLALRLGAAAYFTKPYLEQEFLTALKKLLAPAD
jgi:two-component system, chemotaxis family, sensor histidine kinase and response regulator PixL